MAKWVSMKTPLLQPHANQHYAVPANGGGELVVERAEVFLPPEIADDLLAADAEVGPLHGDRRLDAAAVEQADGLRAVLHVLRPDFAVSVANQQRGLLAERILVDFQEPRRWSAAPG